MMLTGQKTKKQLVTHVNANLYIKKKEEEEDHGYFERDLEFFTVFKIFMYLFHDFLQNN